METDLDYNKLDLLAKALTFAILEHNKNGQTREDNITPYGEHLVRVIEKLRVIGGITNYADLIATALHDILEDTDVPETTLRETYGDEVLMLVDGMTKKRDDDNNAYLTQLKYADHRVKAIKLADRLDNIQDLMRLKTETFGNVSPLDYIKPSYDVLETCRSGNEALAKELELYLQKATDMFTASTSSHRK